MVPSPTSRFAVGGVMPQSHPGVIKSMMTDSGDQPILRYLTGSLGHVWIEIKNFGIVYLRLVFPVAGSRESLEMYCQDWRCLVNLRHLLRPRLAIASIISIVIGKSYFSHLYWLSWESVSCFVKSARELKISRSRISRSRLRSMKS